MKYKLIYGPVNMNKLRFIALCFLLPWNKILISVYPATRRVVVSGGRAMDPDGNIHEIANYTPRHQGELDASTVSGNIITTCMHTGTIYMPVFMYTFIVWSMCVLCTEQSVIVGATLGSVALIIILAVVSMITCCLWRKQSKNGTESIQAINFT